MSAGAQQAVAAAQDETGGGSVAGVGQQVGQAVAARFAGAADAATQCMLEGLMAGVEVGVVGIPEEMGEDSDAGVADGYLQASVAGGFAAIGLGGDECSAWASSVTDGIVDQFADAFEDFSAIPCAEVVDGDPSEPLADSVGALRLQGGYFQQGGGSVIAGLVRGASFDSGGVREYGEQVHALDVGSHVGGRGQQQCGVGSRGGVGVGRGGRGGQVEGACKQEAAGVQDEAARVLGSGDGEVVPEQRVSSGEFQLHS